MKTLSDTWKQRKKTSIELRKNECSTPVRSNAKVKLVEDVSPVGGFGNSQLFCDAEFLRAIDDLERNHAKQQATTSSARSTPVSNSEGPDTSSAAERRSHRLLRRHVIESTDNLPNEMEIPVCSSFESKHDDMASGAVNRRMSPIIDEAQSDSGPTLSPSSLLLSSWGLPEPVLERYRECGVESMFEWQVSCLASDRVLEGGNLVYSAPTSAGKTLVAEILMLKCVLERKKKGLMILPFVSVAQEKMHYLKKMFRDVGVRVDGYMGQHAPAGGFSKVDIAVCTIEKANGLVNRLLEEGNLDQLGIVVVDELHMLGDPSRGYLLELLLTKIRYMQKKSVAVCESQSGSRPASTLYIQVVGMSATLPNLNLLSRWLDAELFSTQFRPVPLTESLKTGLEVKTVNEDGTLKVSRLLKPSPIADDADHVVQLCLETVADSHGVLVFCPAKQWCENLAETIAKEIFQLGKDQENVYHGLAHLREGLRASLSGDSLVEVLGHLKKSPAGLDKILAKTVPFGVAFHHAGLTMEEREILENAFRQGALKVMTATSTLSSGVNLPARRVIVRTPTSHHGMTLDVLTYRQMMGRAGRKGLDDRGESILICRPPELTKAVNLVKAKLKPVSSCLIGDCKETLSPALKRAILEIVVSGAAKNSKEVDTYASSTLLALSATNSGRPLDVIKDYIEFLVHNEFIRLHTVSNLDGDDIQYAATPLGRAVLASSLSPDEGLVVYKELAKARRCFVLENELHIIYQVTPIYLTEQWSKLDWVHYFELWERLSPDMKLVSSCVGVEERFLASAARGWHGTKSDPDYATKLSVHLRFYTALALHDVVNEMPLTSVARKYGCNKGMLQALQQSAAVFSGMVTVFCHQLGWLNMELLLAQFQSRLHFGVHQELCDLVRLTCLNARRARNLHDAGYKTVAQLAVASLISIETILKNSGPFESEKRKDNESEQELAKRLQRKTIWLPGRKGVTESEAAALLIQEARDILQKDLGIQGVDWSIQRPNEEPLDISRSVTNKSSTSVSAHIKQESTVQSGIKAPGDVLTQRASQKIVEDRGSENSFREYAVVKAETSVNPSSPKSCSTVCDVKEENAAEDGSGDRSVDLNFSLTFGANHFLDRLVEDRIEAAPKSVLRSAYRRSESPEASELQLSSCDADQTSADLMLEDGSWTLPSNQPIAAAKFDVELTTATKVDLEQPDEVQKVVCANTRKLDGSGEDIVESDSPAWIGMNGVDRVDTYAKLIIDESSTDDDSDENGEEMQPESLFPDDSVFIRADLLSSNISTGIVKRNDCDSMKRSISPRLSLESASKKVCVPMETSNNSLELIPPTPSPKASNNGIVTPTVVIVNSKKTPIKVQRQQSGSLLITGGRLTESTSSHIFIGSAIMVVVTEDQARFKKFLEMWRSKTRFCIAFAGEKRPANATAENTIGLNILKDRRNAPKIKPTASERLPWLQVYETDVVIVGMAVCWDEDSVFYVSFESNCPLNAVVEGVSSCLFDTAERKIIVAYELKEQLKVLYEVFGGWPQNFEVQDPRVAAWLLDVTSANDSFRKHACLSEDLTQSFPEKSSGSPGLTVYGVQKSGCHRAVIEAYLTLGLMDRALVKLKQERLLKDYKEIEMPVLIPFLKMELNGLGFNEKSFQHSRVLIQTRIAELEARSEALLGHPLNMACKTALKRALYEELQLPTGADASSAASAIGRRLSVSSASLASPSQFFVRRQRLQRREGSTSKEALQRLMSLHELPNILLEWRRLQSALVQKVIPIMKEKRFHARLKMHRVYGCNETHTLTGRAVLKQQMVERNFQIETRTSNSNVLSQSDRFNLTTVSLRRAFFPYRGAVLISADYSQLELRILAHLSEEANLIRVLNGGADVFKAIAAQWKDRAVDDVTDDERQQAKQICYGMVYGIGAKSLGDKLGVGSDDALAFMNSFKSRYPGIGRYIESVHERCRRLGYVETIMGRRRPLPDINDENAAKRAAAERQAVNTTVQGTAADISKKAIIDVDRQMEAIYAGTCRPIGDRSTSSSQDGLTVPARGGHFVLQLHDELIYETSREDANRVANIIKNGMEGAVKLLVRLPVNIKMGPTWGDLSLSGI